MFSEEYIILNINTNERQFKVYKVPINILTSQDINFLKYYDNTIEQQIKKYSNTDTTFIYFVSTPLPIDDPRLVISETIPEYSILTLWGY